MSQYKLLLYVDTDDRQDIAEITHTVKLLVRPGNFYMVTTEQFGMRSTQDGNLPVHGIGINQNEEGIFITIKRKEDNGTSEIQDP